MNAVRVFQFVKVPREDNPASLGAKGFSSAVVAQYVRTATGKLADGTLACVRKSSVSGELFVFGPRRVAQTWDHAYDMNV